MHFRWMFFLFLFCFFVSCSVVSIVKRTGINETKPYVLTVANCIRDPNCHKRFVVSHRASGFAAPENSREAIRKAVEARISAVEIDVRFSKDKKLFVIHDSLLDRTTNDNGSVGDRLSDELVEMRLKEGNETIPTLQDIYEITHERTILFIDIKGNCVQEVAEWIAEHGSFDDVVFILNEEGEFASAATMKLKYPKMIISAEAYSKADILLIEKYFPNHPDIIDIGFPAIWKYCFIVYGNQKIYTSSLVLEIGLPFLKYFWPIYINLWNFDFLETNNPLFWQNKLPQ